MPVTESGSCKQNIIYIMALISEQKQMNKNQFKVKVWVTYVAGREREMHLRVTYLIMHMHLKA